MTSYVGLQQILVSMNLISQDPQEDPYPYGSLDQSCRIKLGCFPQESLGSNTMYMFCYKEEELRTLFNLMTKAT